jgi:hypothetical protein
MSEPFGGRINEKVKRRQVSQVPSKLLNGGLPAPGIRLLNGQAGLVIGFTQRRK